MPNRKPGYYVEVLTDDHEVVKSMGPMSERKADKVEGGVLINLDHENYWTRIVKVGDPDE